MGEDGALESGRWVAWSARHPGSDVLQLDLRFAPRYDAKMETGLILERNVRILCMT